MKNRRSPNVRNRTSEPDRPVTRDRRVQRTTASLQRALIGLAHEKPYQAIAVKEILDRANVGRSTFYAHFRDKDELLESGIREILRSVPDRPVSGAREQLLAFALPILQYVDQHRRGEAAKTTRQGRSAMHARLERVLVDLIIESASTAIDSRRSTVEIPVALLARHIAATFVLLLNWWVETDSPLTPAEIDARFRALVMPALPQAQ